MKAYLLTHSPLLTTEYVHGVLGKTQSIDNWLAPFPNAAFVASKLTVTELSAVLHSHFGEMWFLLVEVHRDNSNGWMPQNFWDFIYQPRPDWFKSLGQTGGLRDVKSLPPRK